MQLLTVDMISTVCDIITFHHFIISQTHQKLFGVPSPNDLKNSNFLIAQNNFRQTSLQYLCEQNTTFFSGQILDKYSPSHFEFFVSVSKEVMTTKTEYLTVVSFFDNCPFFSGVFLFLNSFLSRGFSAGNFCPSTYSMCILFVFQRAVFGRNTFLPPTVYIH